MKRIGARATLLVLPWLLAACAPLLGGSTGPTEAVVLPSGEICAFAGEGATLAFDDQRLAWTCDVAETGPRGLFGAPVVIRDVHVYWRIGTTARRPLGGGFELTQVEAIEERVARLELVTGETCAFVGEESTLALSGRRVNYTCGDDIVLLGGFNADDLGLLATRAVLSRQDDALTVRNERVVRVRAIVLDDAAGAAAEAAARAEPAEEAMAPHAPLLGTTWALERIVFADGGEVVPEEPERYTLTLSAAGSVALLADCNRGAGPFELDDASLTIGEVATTRAACPPGSIDQVYLTQLAAVASYAFVDGRLVLASEADASLLTFRSLP